MSKAKLKAISGKLKKASQAHAGQAKQLDAVASAMPLKKSSALKKIPLRKEFVKKYDDIEAAFKKTAQEQNLEDYDKKIAEMLIKENLVQKSLAKVVV